MIRYICLFILAASMSIQAQDAGLSFYGGFSSGAFDNENYTPNGQVNKGYLLMAEARLTDGRTYMLGGIGINRVNMVPDSESFIQQDFTMNFFKIRAGLGFQTFKLTDKISFHAALLVSTNVLTSFPQVTTPLPTPDLNTYSFAVTPKVQLFAYGLSLGLEHDRSFTDIIPEQGLGTGKFHNWFLTAGFFF